MASVERGMDPLSPPRVVASWGPFLEFLEESYREEAQGFADAGLPDIKADGWAFFDYSGDVGRG